MLQAASLAHCWAGVTLAVTTDSVVASCISKCSCRLPHTAVGYNVQCTLHRSLILKNCASIILNSSTLFVLLTLRRSGEIVKPIRRHRFTWLQPSVNTAVVQLSVLLHATYLPPLAQDCSAPHKEP
jgi:hypothetical protein